MMIRAGFVCLVVRFALTAAVAQEEVEPLTGLQAALIMEKAVVSAIAEAETSVVAIARVRHRDERGIIDREPIDPTDPHFVPSEYGTGVVIEGDGLILTNHHVIGNPEENSYYVWSGGKPFRVVEVKAADPWTDLAVLKIDADNLKPIKFGDAKGLKKGQIVIALGNPYAIARDGEASASWGIISNLSRKATKNPTRVESKRGDETLHHFGTLIQTDAKLNLGTSGGALINLEGEMIGLTTSLAAMGQYEKSAGFAIPVDDVFQRTVEQLKAGQKAEFGFLGVSPRDLDYKSRRDGKSGVIVSLVVAGTPAAKSDLRIGDVITHVNTQVIHDTSQLMRELGKYTVEATVRLTIERNQRAFSDKRERLSKSVKLSKKYIELARASYSQTPEPTWRGMRVDFATANPYFQYKSDQIDPKGCVTIVEVERDSAAWKSGLRPWTFINYVGSHRVSTPQEFYDEVANIPGNVRIQLTAAEGSESPYRTVSP